MVYKWKDKSMIKCNPQIAGEFIEKVSNEHGGNITAQILLDESRPENAPLHDDFEWDDSIAAEEYRKYQSRKILNSIKIVVEPKEENKEPVETRALFVIKEEGQSTYKPLNVILKSEDYTEQLYNTALKELVAIKNKYSTIQKLKHIFDEIEKEENK